MESLLICSNSSCRFLVDLRDAKRLVRRSALPLRECPECGDEWSNACPFCAQHLNLEWADGLPHCASCHRTLRPDEAARLSSLAAENHAVR
jgi:hypothetical protein